MGSGALRPCPLQSGRKSQSRVGSPTALDAIALGVEPTGYAVSPTAAPCSISGVTCVRALAALRVLTRGPAPLKTACFVLVLKGSSKNERYGRRFVIKNRSSVTKRSRRFSAPAVTAIPAVFPTFAVSAMTDVSVVAAEFAIAG